MSKDENDKRILDKMREVYNQVNDDIDLNDEVKIILETIKAGYDESRNIHKEPNNDDYYSDIDQFLYSCVAGKCLCVNDDITDDLHPYFVGGYRIKALIQAIYLLKIADLVEDFKFDDGPYINVYRCDEAKFLFDKLDLNKKDD